MSASVGMAHAAGSGPGAGLSPDLRPVLVLEPPHGALQLVHHAVPMSDKEAEALALKLGYWKAASIVRRDREDRRRPLPQPWLTAEPDRGFGPALLMQLSAGSANWPWRTLVVSGSGTESDSKLKALGGQDAVVAAVRDELVDLLGKVELHVTMQLLTVRAIATPKETRVRTQVEYFAAPLAADSAKPRPSRALFAMDGPLDDQVGAAATDLSQFLATIVARVSVPESLHPHNPTLGELGLHPTCAECRASDPVIHEQPGRVWVRVGGSPGTILALPITGTQETGK